MKSIITKAGGLIYIVAAIFFVTLSGCKQPDGETPEPTLTVTPKGPLENISPAMSVIEFDIESTGTDWSIESSETWVKADKSGGTGNATVRLTVEGNETTEPRTATVSINATEDNTLNKKFTIKQRAFDRLPAAAGEIEGADEAVGYVELSVAEIERATSYKWYLDDEVVPYADGRTLQAFESGEYRVEGVNEHGAGEKSPAKSVTILYNIDNLVGTYEVKAFLFTTLPKYIWDHTAVIEKIDDTTVKIKNFFGIEGSMFDYQPGVVNLDEVIATFDAKNCTLTFNSNLIPIGYDETSDYETFLVPADFEYFCENYGLEFPIYPIQMSGEDVIIDFQTGFSFKVDDQEGRATCTMIALNEQGECNQGFFNLSHAVFTKVSSETDLPILPIPKTINYQKYTPAALGNGADNRIKFTLIYANL